MHFGETKVLSPLHLDVKAEASVDTVLLAPLWTQTGQQPWLWGPGETVAVAF